MRPVPLTLGLLALALAWLGPLPDLAVHSFSAHMTMHMGVVAVAAPLISLAVAGSTLDPVRRLGGVLSPVPASVIELIVVWVWHAPALHHAARASTAWLLLEQSMFLASGLLVWFSALGCEPGRQPERHASGVVALLLTSMHMTLLGALLALSPRALYLHGPQPLTSGTPLDDQHLGGAVMLLVGGISYLAGGLWLSASVLTRRPLAPGRERT